MDGQAPNAADVLGQLWRSLNRMLDMLQTMVTTIRPSSASTLPAVSETLSGIAAATEHAALQVLDEAEALQGDQAKLGRALERVRQSLPPKDAEALTAWAEAAACSNALSARVLRIMAAMEFQDLTTQHIAATLRSIEDVRERLRSVLSIVDLPAPEADAASPADRPPSLTAQPNRAAQAIADELLAQRG